MPELYEGQLVSEQKSDTSTPALPGEGDRLHSSFDLLLPQWKEGNGQTEHGLPTVTLWGFLHSSLIIKVPILRKRNPGLLEVKQPDRVQGHE